jgi:hypothetical protein
MVELEVCSRSKPNVRHWFDDMVAQPLTLEANAAICFDGEVRDAKAASCLRMCSTALHMVRSIMTMNRLPWIDSGV